FAATAVPDRSAAERSVLEREAYGAVVLGPQGAEILLASAASPAVAQILAQLAQALPAEVGGPAAVIDLAPLPPDDPRGVGLASAVLPLVIGGILAGAAAALQVTGRARQIGTVLAVALVAGLVLTAILQTWLGSLAGSYWANAGVLAL